MHSRTSFMSPAHPCIPGNATQGCLEFRLAARRLDTVALSKRYGLSGKEHFFWLPSNDVVSSSGKERPVTIVTDTLSALMPCTLQPRTCLPHNPAYRVIPLSMSVEKSSGEGTCGKTSFHSMESGAGEQFPPLDYIAKARVEFIFFPWTPAEPLSSGRQKDGVTQRGLFRILATAYSIAKHVGFCTPQVLDDMTRFWNSCSCSLLSLRFHPDPL